MVEKSHLQKVLWAIDPLAKDKGPQEIAARVLQSLSQSLPFTIQPVSVILEDQIPYLVGQVHSPADFKTQIEDGVKTWLNHFQFRSVLPFQLLVEKEFSLKSGVKTLLQFASDNHFDVIIASTHAKKRNGESELGTFAETLFLYSHTPILLVSPKAKVPQHYKEIFFPTDLSTASRQALKAVESIATGLKAHVTLFHKIFSFTKDVVEFPYSADARSNYLERVHYDQQGELEKLTEELKAEGIPTSFVIDRVEADYISKSITQRAERTRDCLIAMASHTGNDSLSLPGSITRQVIRGTTIPVLVLHPEAHPR